MKKESYGLEPIFSTLNDGKEVRLIRFEINGHLNTSETIGGLRNEENTFLVDSHYSPCIHRSFWMALCSRRGDWGHLLMSGVAAQAGLDDKHAIELAMDIINTTKYKHLNLPLSKSEGLPNLGGAKVTVTIADHQESQTWG